jgi:hypothetical protein
MEMGGDGQAVAVRHGKETGVHGPARGGRKMDLAQEHNANFHLFQNFQLPRN